MGVLDLILHLLGFAAPAIFTGALAALAARVLLRPVPAGSAWWRHAAINSIAGGLALAAGLWAFGVDGKMASYAALVAAVATSQWICSRAWR